MANYEQTDLTGVLFFTKNKQGKQPDRRGSITIGGVEYERAGWNHTTPSAMVCEDSQDSES